MKDAATSLTGGDGGCYASLSKTTVGGVVSRSLIVLEMTLGIVEKMACLYHVNFPPGFGADGRTTREDLKVLEYLLTQHVMSQQLL